MPASASAAVVMATCRAGEQRRDRHYRRCRRRRRHRHLECGVLQ